MIWFLLIISNLPSSATGADLNPVSTLNSDSSLAPVTAFPATVPFPAPCPVSAPAPSLPASSNISSSPQGGEGTEPAGTIGRLLVRTCYIGENNKKYNNNNNKIRRK